MQAASSTTHPTVKTTTTTTSVGTDPTGQFSHSNTTPITASAFSSSVSPVQSPPSGLMSSPPHKPRFTRSPTPYTLQDMVTHSKEDNHHPRSPLQQSPSASGTASNLIPNPTINSTSSCTNQHASNNSNSSGMQNYIYLNDNTSSNHSNNINSNMMKEAGQHSPSSFNIIPSTISNNNNNSNSSNSSSDNNDDYKKPTAGWTLFAQLAKMTPKEVELIRLTKANTAANKQISAVPVTLISPAALQSNSNPASSSGSTELLEHSSSTGMSSGNSSSSSTMDATVPKSFSPKRTRQRRRELSSSPPPISLSVVSETSIHGGQDSFLSSSSERDKSPDSRSSPSTNERGSHSPMSEYSLSSSSSLSPVPSSQSSPSPESSPHRRKRSKLDHLSMPPSALWSPRRRKLSLPLPKSVQIDESKNVVFSYQSGSTIEAFSPVAGAAGSGSSAHDIVHDDRVAQRKPIRIMDEANYNSLSTQDCLDWGLPYVGYPAYKADKVEYAKSLGTTVYSVSHTSATSPWRPLSSADATSRTSSQSESLESSTESLSSSSSSSPTPSQTSWTPEVSGSLDSVLNTNGTNTFANIASSLDTLWSPPMLRRTISEVPSARRGPRPTLSAPRGRAEAVGVGESTKPGVRRVPMLRRQASMPSLEREMSEENPFLEQLPDWNPTFPRPQESAPKIGAATDVKDPILAIQESSTSVQNVCQEVVMTDADSELPADPLSVSTTPVTIVSGSTKGSRGVVRRRDTRQLHHPYRRRASASSTTTSQDGSVDESLLRLPAQFRRSASFSGTTSTPPAQPVIRREVSTTAYMDIL